MRGNFEGKKRRVVLATIEVNITTGPRSLDVYVLKEDVDYVDLLNYPHEEPSLK